MTRIITLRCRGFLTTFLIGVLLALFCTTVDATLHKPANRKIKKDKLPEKVAYNNKNMPADCEVCKLLVNEVEKIIDDEKRVLDEEEEKKKKREQRRKGTKTVSEDDKLKELEKKLKSVCKTLRKYLPQNDLTKFRYISRDTLSETAVLTIAATEPSREQQVKQEYESFDHPETKRLENQCRYMLKKHLKDIMRWKRTDGGNSMSLVDYLCKETVLKNDAKISNCLTKDNVDAILWGQTFEHLVPYHKAAMPDEL